MIVIDSTALTTYLVVVLGVAAIGVAACLCLATATVAGKVRVRHLKVQPIGERPGSATDVTAPHAGAAARPRAA